MAGDDLIEQYLAELSRELRGCRDIEDVLAEVEDHLREVVDAHVRCGMNRQTAERHALGQFGSAELVSRAFAASRGGIAMPTPATKVAGFAAMIGGVGLAVLLALASIRQLDVGGTTAWFAPLAAATVLLVVAGIAGLHLRHRAVYTRLGHLGKWLVPVGVAGAIVSVVIWFVPGGIVAEVVVAIGLVLVGIDVWTAGIVDRRALALVAICAPVPLLVVGLGTGAFGWMTAVAVLGFVGLGGGFAWVGHGLWRERVRVDGSAATLA